MSNDLKHVVCANCLSRNRIPTDRLADGPVCGKCKQPILPAAPIELTQETFHKFVTQSDLPIVIDFWAPWCQPCKMMGPHFAKAAARLQGQVILAKLDTQAYPEPAQPFNIAGIPTMIVFQNGSETQRASGARGEDDIVNWIHSVIG